jgi:hypothetical protein
VFARRITPLALAFLAAAGHLAAAQQKSVPAVPPDEVARAVLRADSAGDWATVLTLAHPEALARFRARQVFQLRMLGGHGWPANDTAVTDSLAEAHWQQVRGRQERFLLDSIFQVPDADSLARTSPDTVYARWIRGLQARIERDSTAPSSPASPSYRVLGAVKASDTLAYVVMERPVEQPLGPLPQMFRDWPRETHMAVVMVMRRYGKDWRSMLDGVGEAPAFGAELLHDE